MSDGTEPACPGCQHPFTVSAITDSRLISTDARMEPLVQGFGGHVHLHRVTVLPIGEERLVPTLRREARTVRRRLGWRLRVKRRRLIRAAIARVTGRAR